MANESMDEHLAEPGSKALVGFYRGDRPDSSGRWLRDIRSWDVNRLEDTHDYIQWLFPTWNRSRFNPDAPILDHEQIREFKDDERLQAELLISFRQLLAFYGFLLRDGKGVLSVERCPDWSDRASNWVSSGNHNHLRITRILTCLRILGLRDHARAFLAALECVYQECPQRIGSRTVEFWKSAAM